MQKDGVDISWGYPFRKRVESGESESVYMWEDGVDISWGYPFKKRVETGEYETDYYVGG
jgi:GH18 family chitinase